MEANYRLSIAYDGTRYYGWEHQPNTDMTIQGKLENVFERMVGSPVKIICAGTAGPFARCHSPVLTMMMLFA